MSIFCTDAFEAAPLVFLMTFYFRLDKISQLTSHKQSFIGIFDDLYFRLDKISQLTSHKQSFIGIFDDLLF